MYNPPPLSREANRLQTTDVSYTGLYYAFPASGGYKMEEGMKTITLLPFTQINQYDMTNAVQVLFDVRTFNTKLGVIKDASNLNVISTTYDPSTNSYGPNNNSITISASDFVAGMTTEEVLSVGALNTMYSSFINYVYEYFGIPNGFSSLFTISSQFDINGGIFDASAFVHIINGKSINNLGQYVKDLSGSVTVNGIKEMMYYCVSTNPFGNRDPSGNANTSSDPTNRNHYTLADGFLQSDLIYIPNGVTVTLTVNVNNNDIMLTSNGQSQLPSINTDYNNLAGNNLFSQKTTVSDTNIKSVVKAPLLFKLKNISGGIVIPV